LGSFTGEVPLIAISISLFIVLLGVAYLLMFVGDVAVLQTLAKRRVLEYGPTPPISILKPLKGVDDGLWENLVSLAEQSYPQFEILVGIEDHDDPAMGLALKLRRTYPNVPIRIVTGGSPIGLNPKVNNLNNSARFAKHELFLISDSNVRVGPDYLRAVAAELGDPKVGLVHSMLEGEGERSVGSLFENLQLNTVAAQAVCGMVMLTGKPCVIGKSMLFRRRDLERMGGFPAVANVLAEDYVMGRNFRQAGLRVVLSPYPVAVIGEKWPLRRFINRHIRWGQMRRSLVPWAFALEPVMNPVLWSLGLAACAVVLPMSGHLRLFCLLLAVAGIAGKSAHDSFLVGHLRGRTLALGQMLMVPVKDLLVFVLWGVAFFKREVEWRGNYMRIGAGSVLTAARPVDSQPRPRPIELLG
jgi:ceramide glucosyltransferase